MSKGVNILYEILYRLLFFSCCHYYNILLKMI